jgi:hypothetical protein
MWINDFSKNNKTEAAMPKVQDKDFKRGDRVNTPVGDGVFVSCNEDTGICTIQMYSDNRTVRLNKILIRKI